MPSLKSSDLRQRICSSMATSRLSPGLRYHAASSARRAPRTASGGWAARRAASSAAAAATRAAETTRVVHPVRQPEPQGRCGVDDVTEQDELAGPALTDDPGQPDRGAHVGHDPVAGLKQADLGALREDTEIAGQSQLKACAVGVAAHGGDAGAAEVRDPAEGPCRGLAHRASALVVGPRGYGGQHPGHALDQVY